MINFKLIKYICLFLIIFLNSCQHEFERPSWNTEWSLPVAVSTLDIYKLDFDSNITWNNLENNQVEIVYQHELIDLEIDSLLDLPPRGVTKNVKLDSISFSNINITYSTTLGQIINDAGAGSFISNGAQTIIPDFPNVLQDTLPLDASEYFVEMNLKEGNLKVQLENQLPCDLSNIVIELRNPGSNNILSINLPYLATNTSYEENVDLQGQIIYGDLELEIINVDLVGTGTSLVTIDYQDALISNILISNIVPFEGLAVFPEQEIFNEDTVVSFDIGDVQLTEALIHSGGVSVEGNSTIQDTIKIQYSIPSATLNGQPFEIYLELPPAPVGGSISEDKFFDFSGYILDLTGQFGDTINTLYTKSTGWIDSSGVLTHISLEDSIYFTLSIVDLKPAYAKGFLGKDTLSSSEIIDINIFEDFDGNFDIESMEVNLSSKNYLGAEANFNISSLSATNINNNKINLNGNILNENLTIGAGIENNNSVNPVSPFLSEISINTNNSNIDEIIELKPNEIQFSYDLFLNPNSNNNGFLYKGYGISTSLDVKLPLSLISENIVLRDTAEFNLQLSDEFNEISFILNIENEFPLSGKIKMNLLDNNNEVLSSLEDDQIINAGLISNNGIVEQSTLSQIVLPFNNSKGILENTKKIQFEFIMNSEPENKHVVIYSDYEIKLTLIINQNQIIN